MGWRIPYCDDCKQDEPIPIILLDEIWNKVAPDQKNKTGILCISCIEKRLGRHITRYDLKTCGITRQIEVGIYIADNEQKDHKKTEWIDNIGL